MTKKAREATEPAIANSKTARYMYNLTEDLSRLKLMELHGHKARFEITQI